LEPGRMLAVAEDQEQNRHCEYHQAEAAHAGGLSPGGSGKGCALGRETIASRDRSVRRSTSYQTLKIFLELSAFFKDDIYTK
jgi:hypothetical protein